MDAVKLRNMYPTNAALPVANAGVLGPIRIGSSIADVMKKLGLDATRAVDASHSGGRHSVPNGATVKPGADDAFKALSFSTDAITVTPKTLGDVFGAPTPSNSRSSLALELKTGEMVHVKIVDGRVAGVQVDRAATADDKLVTRAVEVDHAGVTTVVDTFEDRATAQLTDKNKNGKIDSRELILSNVDFE